MLNSRNKRPVFSVLLLMAVFCGVPAAWLPTAIGQSSSSPQTILDKQIGTMLMVGFRGTTLEASSHVIRDIREYHLGGVILFDYDVPRKSDVRNITSPEQLKQLTQSLQQVSGQNLLIGVDQEGGRVARLKTKIGFERHVSAQYLGELNNVDSTRKHARQSAEQLQNLGINVNFAPVLDVNINRSNPIIGSLERSFSSDPQTVVKHASIFINEFKKHNVMPVVKHFPGHGSSQDDSHLGVVDVTETWQHVELIPFQKLMKKELLPMVMTAHIYNARLDSLWPATLSPNIIEKLLRRELHYQGIVISDDLQMGAIRKQYSLEETIAQSLKAGVDMLLFANNSTYDAEIVPKAVSIIKRLVNEGTVSRESIQRSYNRIQALKAGYLQF